MNIKLTCLQNGIIYALVFSDHRQSGTRRHRSPQKQGGSSRSHARHTGKDKEEEKKGEWSNCSLFYTALCGISACVQNQHKLQVN